MVTNGTTEQRACIKCGGHLKPTQAPFIEKGYIPIVDVEHYICTECGQTVCDEAQWQVLQARVQEWRLKRQRAFFEKPWPRLNGVQNFNAVEDEEDANTSFEDVVEWVGQANNVAKIDLKDEPGDFLMYPFGFLQDLTDAALPATNMELWNLSGFCVEDMPTLQDVFRAADEEALLLAFKKSYSWIYLVLNRPMNFDIHGNWWGSEFLERIREADALACDAEPRIVVPYREYTENGKGVGAQSHIAVKAFSMASATKLERDHPCSFKDMSLEEALGLKAWFGGMRLFDMYRALAATFVQLAESAGVLPEDIDVEFCKANYIELDDNAAEGMLAHLQRGGEEELAERISGLESRLLPIEELETIQLEIDVDLLAKAAVVAQTQGLSMQNYLNLLIDKMLAESDSENEERGGSTRD